MPFEVAATHRATFVVPVRERQAERARAAMVELLGLHLPRVVTVSCSSVPSWPSEADARSSGPACGSAGDSWTTGAGFHGGGGASNTGPAPYTDRIPESAPGAERSCRLRRR